MDSSINKVKDKKFLSDDRGVFGLNNVKLFFAIVLSIALLAYVVVVVMGTLDQATLLPSATEITTVTGEAGWINQTAYTFARANTVPTFTSPTILAAINTTSGLLINAGNYTISGNSVTNATSTVWSSVTFNYTYRSDSAASLNADNILRNTSFGITSFFGAMNPVYAILAITVIILILVVLVRVVGGGENGQRQIQEPQL